MKTPPGTTRNTIAAIAKIAAAASGIYLIFAALVFAVSNLI